MNSDLVKDKSISSPSMWLLQAKRRIPNIQSETMLKSLFNDLDFNRSGAEYSV